MTESQKFLAYLIVVVCVTASIVELIAGNPERGVLYCFWASIALSLWSVLK